MGEGERELRLGESYFKNSSLGVVRAGDTNSGATVESRCKRGTDPASQESRFGARTSFRAGGDEGQRWSGLVVGRNGSEWLILISQHSLTEALGWAPDPLMNTVMHELLRSGTGNQRQGGCWVSGKGEATGHGVKAWVLSPGGTHKVQTLSGEALLRDQPADS